VGAIERSTLNGLDYGGDSYILRMAGSAIDLVNIGNNEYRAKIEGAFYRVRQIMGTNGIYWKVTDKTGRWYHFGHATDSQQDGPPNFRHFQFYYQGFNIAAVCGSLQ